MRGQIASPFRAVPYLTDSITRQGTVQPEFSPDRGQHRRRLAVHYYTFNIGDYRKDTVHLTRLEHSIYRDLIDWYYLDEKPIPVETQSVSRRLRLVSEEEAGALKNVLKDFFVLKDDGWHQARVDLEIEKYHAQCEKNRLNGAAGGRPPKDKNPVGSQSQPSRNPNQEPITNNHSIDESPTKQRTKGSRLSTDFELPDSWTEFCQTERPDLNPKKVFDSFKDYWVAKAGASGVKLDWQATWRNWVRNQNIAKPLFNKADVVHQTVPSSSQRDPALVKLDEDRLKTAPPNPEVLAKIRAVLGKTA